MSIKTVLITGANRGIGLEFVRQLIALPKPPVHVFATCRNPKNAEELQNIAKSNDSVNILALDVKDTNSFPEIRKQVEKVIGESGLNLLINNAGIALRDGIEEVTKESMMEVFQVNTISPLLLSQEFLPLLKTAASKVKSDKLSCTRAGIVNITSKMGSIDDNTGGSCYPYRTSKAALNMVTRSMSVDLKPHGILALVLHPGWVLTEMGGKGALINTQTSVEGMLNTILNSSNEHTGLMFSYDGKIIPW